MANKLATATGNFTTAGTWVTASRALISTSTGTTALTTSNLDSSNFTLAATQIQYLAVRVGTRAAGSPSNKLTVILRNTTTAANTWTFVINVSDLPAVANTTDDNGGWIIFKAASAFTPNGTDGYVVRCLLDSTSTAVALSTNGTANNWQSQIFGTATSAPVAGDDMLIGGIWNTSNPATKADVVVTMDQTAATDYGSATTTYRTAALNLGVGGTLSSAIVANTAYVLQLSGWLVVYSGGTLNLGTVVNPVPRGTGSSTLQFDCAADNDFGLTVRNGGTVTGQGLSRTTGKNVVQTLLTADVAAAGTAMTVADDTGWLSTDLCAIASTSRTSTEAESFTLNGNAGASSLTASAGLGAGHKGSTVEKMQAEVVLLTRQVVIKSVSATAMSTVQFLATATADFDWVLFQNMGGSTAGNIAIDIQITTGSVTFDFCALQTVEHTGFKISTAVNGGTVAIRDTVGYSLDTVSTSGVGFIYISTSPTTTGITVNNVTGIGDNNINGFALMRLQCALTNITLTNVRLSSSGGGTGSLVEFAPTAGTNHGLVTVGPFYLHSAAGGVGMMYFSTAQHRLRIATTYVWRSTGFGIDVGAAVADIFFTGTTVCYGNTSAGIDFDSGARASGMVFSDLRCYGDTSFAQTAGIQFDGASASYIQVISGDFGTASGLWVTHTTADVNFGTLGTTINAFDLTFANTLFASSTAFGSFTFGSAITNQSVIRLPYYNRSATDHRVMTPMGTVQYDAVTFDATPAIKMTPLSITQKLDTAGVIPANGFFVPCDSGQAVTASIKVQIDGTYNGNAPRLILKANAGIGITTDTVIATWSGSSGSFVTISGATASPSAKGVMEFVVDCDGTAGSVYVDTFTVTNAGAAALSGLSYWYNGSPC